MNADVDRSVRLQVAVLQLVVANEFILAKCSLPGWYIHIVEFFDSVLLIRRLRQNSNLKVCVVLPVDRLPFVLRKACELILTDYSLVVE